MVFMGSRLAIHSGLRPGGDFCSPSRGSGVVSSWRDWQRISTTLDLAAKITRGG